MTEITNAIITFFQNLLNNDILTIIVIALFPIIELRGAIPVAFKLGLPWYGALFFSWLGSSLVAPLLLLLLKPILDAMKRCKGFKSLAHAVESTFQGKASKIQSKADAEVNEKKSLLKKMLGVYLFVAIPLPLTGVWTGSAVAVFLGLKFWYALPMVLLGNLTAGIIMTILSVCFAQYVDMILNIFLIIVVIVVLFYIVMLVTKIVKKKKEDKANEVALIENGDTEASTEEALTDTENADDVKSNTSSQDADKVDDDKADSDSLDEELTDSNDVNDIKSNNSSQDTNNVDSDSLDEEITHGKDINDADNAHH